MRRRDFVKTTAAGSAFLLTPGVWAQTLKNADPEFCYQSQRKIPVAYDVDVVVIGGSLAAVAAAVEASAAGARVFLAAQEPYLGEDVCGTFRLWTNDQTVQNTGLGKKIFANGLPTPMHIKKTLDNELIDNNIDFLYSCYITDIIKDENGVPAGVVIANRSGRQAIKAKTVIDATPRALAARLAGAKFPAYPSGKQTFKFTVVGNDLKKSPGMSAKKHQEPIQVKYASSGQSHGDAFSETDIKYSAIEYTLQIDMKDGSYQSFANAEQIARDLTWDANQVESSDLLFQNPPDKVEGQKKYDKANVDPDNISMDIFRPRGIDNIFILSGSAALSKEAAEYLLQPGKLIRIG